MPRSSKEGSFNLGVDLSRSICCICGVTFTVSAVGTDDLRFRRFADLDRRGSPCFLWLLSCIARFAGSSLSRRGCANKALFDCALGCCSSGDGAPLVTSSSHFRSSRGLSLGSIEYVSWRNSTFERLGKCVNSLAMRDYCGRTDYSLRHSQHKTGVSADGPSSGKTNRFACEDPG